MWKEINEVCEGQSTDRSIAKQCREIEVGGEGQGQIMMEGLHPNLRRKVKGL